MDIRLEGSSRKRSGVRNKNGKESMVPGPCLTLASASGFLAFCCLLITAHASSLSDSGNFFLISDPQQSNLTSVTKRYLTGAGAGMG